MFRPAAFTVYTDEPHTAGQAQNERRPSRENSRQPSQSPKRLRALQPVSKGLSQVGNRIGLNSSISEKGMQVKRGVVADSSNHHQKSMQENAHVRVKPAVRKVSPLNSSRRTTAKGLDTSRSERVEPQAKLIVSKRVDNVQPNRQVGDVTCATGAAHGKANSNVAEQHQMVSKRGLRNVSNTTVSVDSANPADTNRVFKKPVAAAVVPRRAAEPVVRAVSKNVPKPAAVCDVAKPKSQPAVQSVIAGLAQLRTASKETETQASRAVAKPNGYSSQIVVELSAAPLVAAENENAVSKKRRVATAAKVDDRFLPPEFAEEMYAHLRLTEQQHFAELAHLAKAHSQGGVKVAQTRTKSTQAVECGLSGLTAQDLFAMQSDVTNSHRSVLIDWLVDVCNEFSLSGDTLHHAVSVVDRYMLQTHVLRAHYQLVGAAALFMMAKFEEIVPPDCEEIAHITADAFTNQQIIDFEAVLFRELRFRLHIPTSRCFAEYLLYAIGVRDCAFDELQSEHQLLDDSAKKQFRIRMFVEFLLELALLDTMRFVRFSNSLLATAAVYLAVHSIWESEAHCRENSISLLRVSSSLLRAALYDDRCASLAACVREMHCVALSHRALFAEKHNLAAICRKYARAEFGRVSTVLPAPLDSMPILRHATGR